MVKLNADMKAGTDAATVTDVQVTHVTQTIAKPDVSGRFSDEDVINVITAWESLQGNRNYSPKDIENWLRDYMSPAINRLRAVLNGS